MTANTSPSIMYGTAWKEDRTEALVEQALAIGYRAIDTANQRRHYFEVGVGSAVKKFLASGACQREELFLQTKFTYVNGQDERLPYDPEASLTTQVHQSMESSLEHLGTDYVDSYVLHGPASSAGWSSYDAEVWEAMAALRKTGKARTLGVSNVSLRHLQSLCSSSPERPSYVQNRCFARMGWDRDVRSFCKEHGIRYQGFSLLTANPEVVNDASVKSLAIRLGATPAQVVLRFAQLAGMIPLTGTTDAEHMRQDLASGALELAGDEVTSIESLSG